MRAQVCAFACVCVFSDETCSAVTQCVFQWVPGEWLRCANSRITDTRPRPSNVYSVWHTSAYCCILVHTSAYYYILVHTSAYYCILLYTSEYQCILVQTVIWQTPSFQCTLFCFICCDVECFTQHWKPRGPDVKLKTLPSGIFISSCCMTHAMVWPRNRLCLCGLKSCSHPLGPRLHQFILSLTYPARRNQNWTNHF